MLFGWSMTFAYFVLDYSDSRKLLNSFLLNKIPDIRTEEPRHPARMKRIAPDVPGLAIATRKITVDNMKPVFLAKWEKSVMY